MAQWEAADGWMHFSEVVPVPLPSLSLCKEDAALHQSVLTGPDGDSSLIAPSPVLCALTHRRHALFLVTVNFIFHLIWFFLSYMTFPPNTHQLNKAFDENN